MRVNKSVYHCEHTTQVDDRFSYEMVDDYTCLSMKSLSLSQLSGKTKKLQVVKQL